MICLWSASLGGQPTCWLPALCSILTLACCVGLFVSSQRSRQTFGNVIHVHSYYLGPPLKWIASNLSGRDSDRTSLLVRSANLYLVGFNASNGVWYSFKGYKHLIPNSIELPYTVYYFDFMGVRVGGKWKLHHLSLWSEFYLDSLTAFSEPSNRNLNLGVATAKLLIMTIEAVCFYSIIELVEMH
jgi:hypothetical protein